MGRSGLRLLTYNAGLFRYCVFGRSLVEPAPHVTERFNNLAPALLSTDADVIALQEVYEENHQQELIKSLFQIYPHSIAQNDRRFGKVGSGLMFFSKFPFIEKEWKCFDYVPWDERLFVEKGMLMIKVAANNFGHFYIANSHHTSGGALWDPEGVVANRARSEQYKQLFQTLEQTNVNNCVAMGDFNAGPEVSSQNYKELVSGGYVDAWKNTNGLNSCPTWDPLNPLNASGPHRKTAAQRLDHVLLKKDLLDNLKVSQAKIVFNDPMVSVNGKLFTLSDHYGLVIDLELK